LILSFKVHKNNSYLEKKTISENLKSFGETLKNFGILEFSFKENTHMKSINEFNKQMIQISKLFEEEIHHQETEIIEFVHYCQSSIHSFMKTINILNSLKKSYEDAYKQVETRKQSHDSLWNIDTAEREKSQKKEILRVKTKFLTKKLRNLMKYLILKEKFSNKKFHKTPN
jgi:hypothetical protein